MSGNKLYVSALSFDYNSLSKATKALQEYLDLGINPVLTDTNILMSVLDYSKTFLNIIDNANILRIYDSDGHEVYDWHIEIEKRTNNYIRGKLICYDIGGLKFEKNRKDRKFLISGMMESSQEYWDTIIEISKKLELIT